MMETKDFKDLNNEGKFLMTKLIETIDTYKKLLPDLTEDELTEQDIEGMEFASILYVSGHNEKTGKGVERIVGKVSREMLIDALLTLHDEVKPTPQEILQSAIRRLGKDIVNDHVIRVTINNNEGNSDK